MKRLRIEAVSKRYRRQGQSGFITPVNKVSIEVDSEEMVVLLGPSGCGKTTLLRCVAGLEQPDEGEIFVNDQLVFSSKKNLFIPPEARPISMVFQSYALWPHMTVFDNVAYPLHAMRLSTRDIKTRVEKTLEAVGLGGLERQFPAQMSGGQQQRVALARALVRETGVILFDEPPLKRRRCRARTIARRIVPDASCIPVLGPVRNARPDRGNGGRRPDCNSERRKRRTDRKS